MQHSTQAQNSSKTVPCRYPSVLPYLDVMEHSVKRMAEVMYAKDYYRALYDEAFVKVMTEIGETMIEIEHLSNDPASQISLIRNFVCSASLAAKLNVKLPAKHLKETSVSGKI